MSVEVVGMHLVGVVVHDCNFGNGNLGDDLEVVVVEAVVVEAVREWQKNLSFHCYYYSLLQ